jgi:ABC-2 type transport system permease protein
VFVLLAAASTALTPTVEMAQVTTTPVLVVPALLSGLFFPLDQLPEPLSRLGQVLPLSPVVDLLRLGLTGTTADGASVGVAASFGPAVVPALVLAAWVDAGVWATRRWFRWEPRR